MAYTVKWVEDNLGVTRDTLRYYEEKGLMPANKDRKYRLYDESDINRIWGIKYLRRIGFSTSEIIELESNQNLDFYEVLNNQISKLEKQRDELEVDISFAKTIKATGRMPMVKEVGNMTFQNFFETARTEWNLGEHLRPIETMTKMSDIDVSLLADEDKESLVQFFDELGFNKILQIATLYTYFKMIGEFQYLGKSHEVVQRIVGLLFQYFEDEMLGFETEPSRFTRNIGSMFLEGDVASSMKAGFGQDKCTFILEALAYFGGYTSLEELYEVI